MIDKGDKHRTFPTCSSTRSSYYSGAADCYQGYSTWDCTVVVCFTEDNTCIAVVSNGYSYKSVGMYCNGMGFQDTVRFMSWTLSRDIYCSLNGRLRSLSMKCLSLPSPLAGINDVGLSHTPHPFLWAPQKARVRLRWGHVTFKEVHWFCCGWSNWFLLSQNNNNVWKTKSSTAIQTIGDLLVSMTLIFCYVAKNTQSAGLPSNYKFNNINPKTTESRSKSLSVPHSQRRRSLQCSRWTWNEKEISPGAI